jgi:hypothetical protein
METKKAHGVGVLYQDMESRETILALATAQVQVGVA